MLKEKWFDDRAGERVKSIFYRKAVHVESAFLVAR